jgi:hypothetical protein
MCSEVRFRAAAVRYASVGTGLGSRTGAEKPTDGAGGSGYADRPRGFLSLTWHFRMPAHCCHLPRRHARTRLGVLNAEGVGDPFVRGISLPVDAVRVDLCSGFAGAASGGSEACAGAVAVVAGISWRSFARRVSVIYLDRCATASEAQLAAPALVCCRMLQMFDGGIVNQVPGAGAVDGGLAELIEDRGVQGDLVRAGDLQPG